MVKSHETAGPARVMEGLKNIKVLKDIARMILREDLFFYIPPSMDVDLNNISIEIKQFSAESMSAPSRYIELNQSQFSDVCQYLTNKKIQETQEFSIEYTLIPRKKIAGVMDILSGENMNFLMEDRKRTGTVNT